MTTKKRHNRLNSQELIAIQQNIGGSKVNTFFPPALRTHRGEKPKNAYTPNNSVNNKEDPLADLKQLGEQSSCQKCVIL